MYKIHLYNGGIINEFKGYLIDNDKSVYTIDKYIRDVMKFKEYVCD